jgi:hypothetical protein
MARPNLARQPFLDRRPVVVVGAALTVIALALTAVTVSERAGVRGEEQALARTLRELQQQRGELAARAGVLDRELSRVSWQTLEAEAASLRQVVAQRKFAWTSLLADLEPVLPWDVRLIKIDPRVDEDGQVTIGLDGIAASREAWLRLLARLFSDLHFSDPMPEIEQAPGTKGGDSFTFKLTVKYWPEGRP